jgi:hypothetical protein
MLRNQQKKNIYNNRVTIKIKPEERKSDIKTIILQKKRLLGNSLFFIDNIY